MRLLRAGATLLAAGIILVAAPTPAQAHPLGNFTTNQYAGLRVTGSGVDVDYVLDLAELPAYQARQGEIDTDGDGRESRAELDNYASATCRAVAAATVISFAGRSASVSGRAGTLTFPPGAGGLTTLRLQCALHADGEPRDGTEIWFQENYLTGRVGWREITAVGDRYTLTSSDVPAASVSERLTAYPKDVPTDDARSARLTVRPGGPAAAMFPEEQNLGVQPRGVDRLTRWFTDLVGHPQLTWGVGALALLIAFVLGGAHAAAPGHGKSIMAAYLVGAHGRISHALTVAVTVAITHTVGVLVLGVVLATSLELAPQSLYGWLRVASGVLVALVGAQLLHRALTTGRAAAAHTHTHAPVPALVHDGGHTNDHDDGHAHDDGRAHAHGHDRGYGHAHGHDDGPAHAHAHGDGHTHGHGHAHAHGNDDGHGRDHGRSHSHGGVTHTHVLPQPDAPFRLRSLLAMGFAGGLSPSPSAVVVLLGAAALGRAWYGVLLVLTYGIGLAAVLTGIGLALARWGERLRRAGSGRLTALLAHRLPTLTAAVILTVGIGMAAFSLAGLYTG